MKIICKSAIWTIFQVNSLGALMLRDPGGARRMAAAEKGTPLPRFCLGAL
jgi:hypothetical protein